ncbi:MAG: hypothetical protein DRO11_08120 [Methanobacteriota archaeon]|nr:MAG: hypothetical protein DRO11_08120 [Euryarchaeota archaeon]
MPKNETLTPAEPEQSLGTGVSTPQNHDLALILIHHLIFLGLLPVPILSQSPIRAILGLPIVIFYPGYALVAALFPEKKSLDNIELVALSFGLSIALVPLLGIILNYTPWGIRLTPIVLGLTILTSSLLVAAYIRRNQLPPEQRRGFRFTLEPLRPHLQERGTKAALTVIIVATILTGVYIWQTPQRGERFTEFYILGPEGKASGYPTALRPGEHHTLILGVVNHEYEKTNYLVEVRLGNRSLKTFNLTLGHEEKYESPITITVPHDLEARGKQKLRFLRYKEGVSAPYIEVYLMVET